MKGAEPGLNFFESAGNRFQAVVPGPSQSNAAPPQAWTSIPRLVLYQAPSALGSLDLKKMPPMPVTLFIQILWKMCLRYAEEVYPTRIDLFWRRDVLGLAVPKGPIFLRDFNKI